MENLTLVTIEEYESRQSDITKRLIELDEEHRGRRMSAESRSEWNELNEEREANQVTLDELRARKERVAEIAEDGGEADTGFKRVGTERGADFRTRRSGVARGDDIYDLSTVPANLADPAAGNVEMRDRAMRSLESVSFPHIDADEARSKDHLEKLLNAGDELEDFDSAVIARRMLLTGSREYRAAFAKSLMGRPLSSGEQRALDVARSLTIGSTGNYPVPYALDPTLIPVSNGSVNPFRAVSRVIPITGNTWRGVNAAAITAAYAAESTEASDNTPTLTQPEINVEKAQAFVPFSIEAGQDWGGLQSEIAMLFADAKDDLEATKFAVGAGHGSNEPQGVITGATTTVTAGGTAAFAVADVYKTEEALPPRFRSRAQWVANRFIYNKVRQFDTGGGASLWMYLDRGLATQQQGGNTNAQLIGYAANESSAMAAALTTGSKIAVLGDFRYYAIIDRIGMDVELVPHLFGANGRPTGERGLYAYWRNSAEVLSAAAFRVLVTG